VSVRTSTERDNLVYLGRRDRRHMLAWRAFALEGKFLTVDTSYTATGGGNPATLSIDSARIRAGFIEENSQVRRFRTVDFEVTALRLKPDGMRAAPARICE